jgi:acyl transferase domain-containing protein
MLSALTGATIPPEQLVTPEYWQVQVQHPDASQNYPPLMLENTLKLAIGPCPATEATEADWLCSLRPEAEDWQALLHGLGELYIQGIAIDWVSFDQAYGRQRLALPTYPFQRQRYWFPSEEPEQQASRPDATEAQRFDQNFELIHRADPQHSSRLNGHGITLAS